MQEITRRGLMQAGAAGLASSLLPGWVSGRENEIPAEEFAFHHDHILGTSFDLIIQTNSCKIAAEAESLALREIDRLRKVFSLQDPESELSRLNRTESAMAVSADLLTVLRHYENWQPATGWALNAQVDVLRAIWKTAETEARLPEPERLHSLVRVMRSPAWNIDSASGLVTRTTSHTLDLNAAAKGYIVQRVGEVLKSNFPDIASGLVNLGGDMFGWGRSWPIGIQNPKTPEENAIPLAAVRLNNSAVATSGGYQRYFVIDSLRYSHLIDPRTGQSAESVCSATVTARDSTTANLLATTLCVLGVEEGLRLIESISGVECLLVNASGEVFTSSGLELQPILSDDDKKKSDDSKTKPKSEAWPEGYQVSINLEIPKIEGAKKYRRPYVAVWIETEEGKAIRTLAVWGNAPKYLKDLTDWWKIGKDDKDLIKAVTRATRGPGKYDLVWDGKDDKGKKQGQGTYQLKIEVHREHGKHLRQTTKLECRAEKFSASLEKNDETGDTSVEYGPKKTS